VLLVLAVRRICLHWRGRLPRVQITQFAWAAPDQKDREAAWVTSLFREELGALRLDTLDPLPERAPGAPLVEIVEGVSTGLGGKLDLGKAIGRLWRAAWPDSAYEVWGTARPRENGHGGRLSVQLVDGRRRTLVGVALGDDKWENGARQAAMAVAGALYPRVRDRHKGPWADWKRAVPRKLIASYHEARSYEKANRLEEAMGGYHRALQGDPLNPHLRLKIAMLQERLALYLDAWVTYRAIVDPGDRKAWTGPNRKARLIAVFRLAILLGNDQIARQCVESDYVTRQPTDRDRERKELRDQAVMALRHDDLLTKGLSRGEKPAKRGFATASAKELLRDLRGPAENNEEKRKAWISNRFGKPGDRRPKKQRITEINELLEIIGLRWLEELGTWVGFRPPWSNARELKEWRVHRPSWRQFLRRREFSASALEVSTLAARTRIAASAAARTKSGSSAEAACFKEHKELLDTWPFDHADSRSLRRWWDNRRNDAWQLHYNASCAVSTVLLDKSLLRRAGYHDGNQKRATKNAERRTLPDRMTEVKLIRRAVAELEEYARRATSHRVAAQADWVGIDDPDLVGLAATDEFKLWASHHLPILLPQRRPRRSADVNRYTAQIVLRGAEAFADSWKQRAAARSASADELVSWWKQEVDAWTRLRDVCRERRSWRCRLEGLIALQAWLQAVGRSERIDFGHEDRSRTAVSGEVDRGLFGEITRLVGNGVPANGSRRPSAALLPWVHQRATAVQRASLTGAQQLGQGQLDPEIERGESLRASRIWTLLAEALRYELGHDEGPGATPPRKSLRVIRKELSAYAGASSAVSVG
jgi:tetratricopeptide (TPR) repeat protein